MTPSIENVVPLRKAINARLPSTLTRRQTFELACAPSQVSRVSIPERAGLPRVDRIVFVCSTDIPAELAKIQHAIPQGCVAFLSNVEALAVIVKVAAVGARLDTLDREL